MTRYLLDTNILSDLIRNPQGKAARRIGKQIGKAGEASVCTSVIVAAELRYGCAKIAKKSGSPRLSKAVEDLLSEIEVLPFEPPADVDYGDIRAALEAAGTPIGGNDLLIAAHARALGAIVVTANVAEFKCVRGVKVENWLG
ncbi:MAG: type II toxin-antitoxin system VapC family toxin [Pseudolabrys sp.]|nr:type II toxin-antitoxin system VapC family toxin [Pseudolabrys sp.]